MERQRPAQAPAIGKNKKELYNKAPSHDTEHGTGTHWHYCNNTGTLREPPKSDSREGVKRNCARQLAPSHHLIRRSRFVESAAWGRHGAPSRKGRKIEMAPKTGRADGVSESRKAVSESSRLGSSCSRSSRCACEWRACPGERSARTRTVCRQGAAVGPPSRCGRTRQAHAGRLSPRVRPNLEKGKSASPRHLVQPID